MVHDRGYARVRNFAHARANGADFLTRIGWCSLKLFDLAGQSFDLLAGLPESGAPVIEHQVRIGSARAGIPARLIIARKPAEATERQQVRLRRKASRKGHKTDPRTLRTAGFMMLLTSLSEARATAEEVVRLYRMRWQIELAFKRLKSLGGFAELRASDPRLARTWLLAHLIAAVLIETSLGEALDSPPELTASGMARPPSLWRAWQAAHRRLQGAIFVRTRRRVSQATRVVANRRLAEAPRRRCSQAKEAQYALS